LVTKTRRPIAAASTLGVVVTLFAGLAAAAPGGGAEADLRFRRYTRDDGLSEHTANQIAQDRVGFIWVATDDGLNRFDGYTFRVYRHDPERLDTLSNNVVRDLLLDHEGELWVASEGGLDRYRAESDSFVRYQHVPGDARTLVHSSVHCLLEDRSGVIWAGTYMGLDRLDRETSTFSHFRHDPQDPSSLSADHILSLAEDPEAGVWVGTQGGGLNHLDPETGRSARYLPAPGEENAVSSGVIRDLAFDAEGRLWIATEGGLDRLDPRTGRFTHFRHDPRDPRSLGSNLVWSILFDSRGELWVGTDGAGLDRFEPERGAWKAYVHDEADPQSLGGDSVRDVFEDRSGDLWVGGYASGLHFLNRHRSGFRYFTHNRDGTGLAHRSVLSFHEDRDGTLWIGTEGGLHRRDPKTGALRLFRHRPDDPHSLGGNAVLSILRDHQEKLWVGTFAGGLDLLVDEKAGRFERLLNDPRDPHSISDSNVWSLLEDHRGELWVGTLSMGLNRLDRQSRRFTRYLHVPDDPTSLPGDTIWALFEDREERLWVCTGEGLCRYDPERDAFVAYPGASRDVLTIQQDSRDRLWLGTRGDGLQLFDPDHGSVVTFSTADGLPNDVVNGILEDGAGHLWLSTNEGLSRFDPEARTFVNFDSGSGLQGRQFNRGAFLKSRTGELLFGGTHGYNVFFPDQVRGNPHVPPVVITDFLVFNQQVPIDPAGPLSEAIEEASEVRLSYQQSVFTFRFAALGYRNPEKSRYQYRLLGFDKDWVESGNRRSVTYTNLDPGAYRFQVRGSNDDGLWNRQGASVRLRITPPVWRTAWFRALVLGLFAALLVAGHGLRTRFIRERNRELKKEVDERKRVEAELEATNAELEAKNVELEQFAYTASHDLRAPLVTIRGYLYHVRQDIERGRGDRTEHDLGRIEAATDRMGRLLEDLLELSRAGRVTNERTAVDLEALAQEAVEQLEGEITQRGGRVVVVAGQPSVLGDRTRLREVYQNLIDNALTFVAEGTRPEVEVGASWQEGAEVTCYVRDNGIGIDPADRERVFGLFERLGARTEGTGIGLALVRRIVEAHGGRVWVESEGVGKGATFRFTLLRA